MYKSLGTGIAEMGLCIQGLPTFDMAEGVLDRAMDAYKQLLPLMGGYVVEGGNINSFKLEQLLHKIARMEAELLSQRVKVSYSLGLRVASACI